MSIERNNALEEAAHELERSYPDNVNTNAFCAAIRALKSVGANPPSNKLFDQLEKASQRAANMPDWMVNPNGPRKSCNLHSRLEEFVNQSKPMRLLNEPKKTNPRV